MLQAVIVSSWYIAAQMLADITSLKIITIAGLSMDAGTLVYPITFTLRDLVHKAAGIRVARWLIVNAAIINLFMALLFWVVSRLPGDPSVGEQSAFAEVLSPVWRIVIASILAEVISELVDTEAYRIWIEYVTRKYQWMRVLASNSISVPLDSLIFSWAAFGDVLPNSVVWSIFLSNVLVKGATTIISLPFIYLVRERDVS
jgi:uncharacterized integral membrane protein (TIGR00697 family)